MITICCVYWGDKYDRKYVSILQAMVKRNLTIPHKFVCFTDNPKGFQCETRKLPQGYKGWWNKISLFRKGQFEGKCLYLDLDIVLTGNIDDLVKLDGFHIWADPNVGGFNSSVMLFDPNEDVSKVWDEFDPKWIKKYHGDQDVITMMLPESKTFPEGWCLSYKKDCQMGVPRGTKIVVFHGRPNPSEFTSPWIKNYWKI